MELRPLPPWEGAHPIVVHFPLALLLAAPGVVVLSLLVPRLRRGVALAALAVMAVGAAGATLAVATGEATAEAVEDTPEARAARDLLREHGESGETSRTLFLILTVAYGALVIFPVARGRDLLRKADLAIHGAFLAAYALGCMQLSATGHLRGRLVHEKGVRAPFGAGPDSAPVEDDGRRGRGRGGDRR